MREVSRKPTTTITVAFPVFSGNDCRIITIGCHNHSHGIGAHPLNVGGHHGKGAPKGNDTVAIQWGRVARPFSQAALDMKRKAPAGTAATPQPSGCGFLADHYFGPRPPSDAFGSIPLQSLTRARTPRETPSNPQWPFFAPFCGISSTGGLLY